MVPGNRGRTVAEIGMVAGVLLTVLVRMADLNILVLPIAVGSLLILCRRCEFPLLRLRSDGLVLASATAVAILVWLFFSMTLYGVAIPSTSDTYGVIDRIPNGGWAKVSEVLRSIPLIWPLLTGREFGLIYSAPVLPAGALAIALILSNRWRQNYPLAAVTLATCALYIALPLSIVLIWKTAASYYGYRYLFDTLPICLLGTILFLDGAGASIAKYARKTLMLLSAWSLIGVMFFMTNPTVTPTNTVSGLGRLTVWSEPNYEIDLVKSVVSPKDWVHMAAAHLPGFIAGQNHSDAKQYKSQFDACKLPRGANGIKSAQKNTCQAATSMPSSCSGSFTLCVSSCFATTNYVVEPSAIFGDISW